MSSNRSGYILVVEDEKFMSDILSKRLLEVGYEVEVAENGHVAIEKVISRIPDLVILDLMLPVVDGFDFMRTLNSNKAISKFPILVASNLGQKEDIELALKLGAADYLVKADFSIDDLVAKVDVLIVNKS